MKSPSGRKHQQQLKKLRLLTSQRGEVRLDMDLLQQHSGWKVYGQVTPGLFWKEDVRPGCRASPAVGRRGLEQHLCWLCRRAAGCNSACTQANTIKLSWRKADKMVDPTGRTKTHSHLQVHFTHHIKPYIWTRHLQISWNLHELTRVKYENFTS